MKHTDESRRSPLSAQQAAWFVVGLMIMFLATALITPISMPGPLVDEPIFAKSAFEFARSGRIEISNFSAPNSVFDSIWGGVFAQLFGQTYGVLRFSTLALVAISAPSMYVLCRTLGATRPGAILATGAYLFCPLVFTLSNTFMTDAHAMALVVIAMGLFVSSFTRLEHRLLAMSGGGLFVGLAFLSRPQSLIVLLAAIAAWTIWSSTSRARWQGILAMAWIPVLTFLAHTMWTSKVGEPLLRQMSRESAFGGRQFEDIAALGGQTLVMAAFYMGFFVFPLLPLIWPTRLEWKLNFASRVGLAATTGLITLGLASLVQGQGPFSGHTWVTHSGLGAVDRMHLGHRPSLLPIEVWVLVGLTFLLATAALISSSRIKAQSWPRALRGLVALLSVGFVLAVFASSIALQQRVFDRYWLPAIPLLLAVASSAPRKVTHLKMLASGILVSVTAAVSIIGTIDSFNTYQAVLDFADEAVSEQFDLLEFDGGASWSALTFGLTDDTRKYIDARGGPFWLRFYAINSSPTAGVALETLEDYRVLAKREYVSFLHYRPTYLYILGRDPGEPYFLRVEDF